MVKLPGKLTHFDFTHKKRLLEEEPPNMPLLQEYVIKELEEGIANYLSQQQSAYEEVTGEREGPQMTACAAAAYSPETRKIVEPSFFLDLLKLNTAKLKSSQPMAEFPAHSRHLIWQIPEPDLVRSLHKPRLLSAVLGVKVAATSDNSPHPLSIRGYEVMSRALDLVRQWLESLPQEAWAKDDLNLPLETGSELRTLLCEQFEQADVLQDTVDKKIQIATSEIMRWALVASDTAPPNKVLMGLLGREESLKRISKAARLAQKAAEEPDWVPEGFEWTVMQTRGREKRDDKQQTLRRD
jgi:glutamyl-tRNA synthetase